MDNSKEISMDEKGAPGDMLVVKDILHTIQFERYSLWADLILFTLAAYTYYIGNGEIYTSILKSILAIFLLRYILNLITNYTDNTTKKTHYQINGHIALFACLILLNPLLQLNEMTALAIVIGYTLFVSLMQYGYTVDNLVTLLIVYSIIKCGVMSGSTGH